MALGDAIFPFPCNLESILSRFILAKGKSPTMAMSTVSHDIHRHGQNIIRRRLEGWCLPYFQKSV